MNPSIKYLVSLCRTVPHSIVERVLDEPLETSVKSEVFEGAILSADLVGFTSLCERLASHNSEGLSTLTSVLNQLFASLLEDAMFPYSGYVMQFGGDSLTVVFKQDDCAERAAASALAAQRLMHGELGRLLEGQPGELMLRIGVAKGTVRLSVLGDVAQRSAVCAGETAHRAVRLQQLAPPKGIMIDEAMLKALATNAEVVERQPTVGVLRGLRKWPANRPIERLEGRTELRVEEKIALLEPFVAPMLAARLRHASLDWKMDAELRPVVILFCELSGVDNGDPQMWLNVSRSLLRAFRKFGGLVAKVDITDTCHRVMVLFGLLRPGENDVQKAALAALDATARARGFTVGNTAKVVTRIGLHQGRVYFGTIGSEYKHDLTIIGDPVNLTARLAHAAGESQVYTTEVIKNGLGPEFLADEIAPLKVKGKSDFVRTYELKGTTHAGARYLRTRSAQRFLAGRDKEIALCQQTIDESIAGQSHVVAIEGEAGIGKSALLGLIVDRWLTRGNLGLLGRCRFATSSQPLAPVVDMFRQFLGIRSEQNEEDRRDCIQRGLQPYNLERRAPELVSLLLPVQRPDGTSEALIDLADPQARDNVLDSIVEFVDKRLRTEALLYVLEDIHLADSLTLQLIARLAMLPRNREFLFVATYRGASVLSEVRGCFDVQLRLGSLNIEATRTLLCRDLAATSVDSEIVTLLWQRSGGNPGYLLELVRFMHTRGLLQRRGSEVHLPSGGVALLDDVLPLTLTKLALSQMDDLCSSERKIVRAASVAGRRFVRDLLYRLCSSDLDQEDFEGSFATLEGRGVFSGSAHATDGFMFRDAAIRAAAYGSLLEADRRELHRRVAEESGKGRANQQTSAFVAHHLERAGHYGAAATAFERAARTAFRTGLYRESQEFLERWEGAVGQTPFESRPSKETMAKMALLRVVLCGRSGRPKQLVAAAEVVKAHLPQLSARERTMYSYWCGWAYLENGRRAEGRALLEHLFDKADDGLVRFDIALLLLRSGIDTAEYVVAENWLSAAQANVEGDDSRNKRLEVASALLLIGKGQYDEAKYLLRETINSARKVGSSLVIVQAEKTLAACLFDTKQYDQSTEMWQKVYAYARAAACAADESNALLGLGRSKWQQGDVDEARALLENANLLARDIGATALEVNIGFLMLEMANHSSDRAAFTQISEMLAESRFSELLSCPSYQRTFNALRLSAKERELL